MKNSNNEKLYTIHDIIGLFPRCTEAMVRNYRWKTGIGRQIEKIIFYTADEVMQFVEDTEFKHISRRSQIYNYIKKHPGITEKQLCKIMPYPEYSTKSILADISQKEYLQDYPDLYEEDNGGLYVVGYEKISSQKNFTKSEGMFFTTCKMREEN